ncbi:MAG: ATP-binding cassette domain-containing protein [Verrucomicrobiales bacterium]|nr:ATP-binding cassette domain-containing protein [Verrucomicrobiales bacterium]
MPKPSPTLAESPAETGSLGKKSRTDFAMARGRGRLWNRIHRTLFKSETPRTEESMLPMLIEVFAGFTKLDGQVVEAEIDSILGFLRYDFPETVYTELRQLFIKSLRRRQDLEAIATDLADRIPLEEKVLLGVQLYVLISRAGLPKENLITFYQFMTTLGVATEAINIVYQLNTSELSQIKDDGKGNVGTAPKTDDSHQLESLVLSTSDAGDISIAETDQEHSVVAFRFINLILIKNLGPGAILARGRQISAGDFCRIYEGQRILIGEEVLGFEDLVFYFNSKKNVSSVQIYLAQDGNGNQFIEKTRTKQSYLRVSFGLDIQVEVLNTVEAVIGGRPLKKGSSFGVSSREKIDFLNHSEISFDDLRRKARELGGRFSLPPNRSVYLVSNDSSELSAGDILLTPGASGKILLRIKCDSTTKTGSLEIIESERPIAVEDQPVRGSAPLKDGSVISLGGGQYLRCHFSEGIIEEERNVINTLKVRDVTHSYDRRTPALDGISLSIQRGEMVCVMGPSGCGKSTLLKALGGQIKPRHGRIDLNGVNLYDGNEGLKSYIALIPQDETFDPLLTVEENLDTAAAIRAPHFPIKERRRRVDSKLIELGLNEIRHRIAGDQETKSLSGGQRRRLNAGMDMIGIADVYLFDEPTSGLSSKDSEHVLDMIRGLTHNKITLVSIHQPSSRLFHMFDKAILLDNGGKLAFFGTPAQMLEYFNEARKQEGIHTSSFTTHNTENESISLTPDFIFDVLETPLRDLGGDILFERDSRGNLIPARRFNSSFWTDRFQTYRLLEEVNLREIESDSSQTLSSLQKTPEAPPRRVKHDWVRFANQFKRAFLSKLRNRANLATTLLEAPALAILIAVVMRYSEDGEYSFANAFHIPTYLFLSLVTALFLGMTNSAEEIIRDRNILQRERHHGFRISGYIIGKYISLGFFALLQCVIYLLIGDAILGIRSMFFPNLLWMGATAFVGIAAGLLISSLVNSPKTAINIIPLILIPNIILGGALIKYDEMNRSLDIIQNIRQWFVSEEDKEEASRLKVPFVCHLMPLRWSYESVIIKHADHNPASRLTNFIEKEIRAFSEIPLDQDLTDEQEERLYQFKQALAVIHGLEGRSPGHVSRQLNQIRASLRNGTFEPEPYFEAAANAEKKYSAGDLYLNEKVQDLFNRAEVERQDYRRQDNPPNVFFGQERSFRFPPNSKDPWAGPFQIETLKLNLMAMGTFILVAFILLRMSLKRQLKKV